MTTLWFQSATMTPYTTDMNLTITINPDDDGGSASVREPRRPLPTAPSEMMALVEP
jgi:hypothetical protein